MTITDHDDRLPRLAAAWQKAHYISMVTTRKHATMSTNFQIQSLDTERPVDLPIMSTAQLEQKHCYLSSLALLTLHECGRSHPRSAE